MNLIFGIIAIVFFWLMFFIIQSILIAVRIMMFFTTSVTGEDYNAKSKDANTK